MHRLSLPAFRLAAALLLAAAALLGGGEARADTFPLAVEFDEGATAAFGEVVVTQGSGGALHFEVSLDPAVLGADADLHRLYLNLDGAFTGVDVITEDPVDTLYELQVDPPVAGGAGADFDYGVGFGRGSGPKGNGTLQTAHFTLVADQALAVEDLRPLSSTAAGLMVQMAVHVQSTAFLEGVDSETVGGTRDTDDDDGGDEPLPS